MRTVLVYLLALAAVGGAALLGFPELFGTAAAEPSAAGQPRRQLAAPVVVAVARRAPFFDSLSALGTVLANESVEITPNRADHVSAVHFRDGQAVSTGQLLVEMQSDEERARLEEAVALRDERKVRHQQVVDLFTKDSASRRDLDNAVAALAAAEARVVAQQAAVDDCEIRAPFAGILGLRWISEGAYVGPSTVVTTLDDLTTVKLDFTIPETWLAAVRAGLAITARSDAWRNDEFTGRVATIDTRLDPRTRSVTVRAELPNPDFKLRPGMLLKITVERGEAPVLQIPEEALIPVGDRQFVWLVGDDNTVARVEVKLGRRRVGTVEIEGGLVEGDRVVVEGSMQVRSGAAVEIAETR